MAMVDVDDSCQFSADSQPKSTGLVWGLAATRRSVCIHRNSYYYFASVAVAVDSSHVTASSSASWSWFSPPSNAVNGHVSTMWFIVCHWPRSHLCIQVSTIWALTCPETAYQRSCMTREIEAWLSDSISASATFIRWTGWTLASTLVMTTAP